MVIVAEPGGVQAKEDALELLRAETAGRRGPPAPPLDAWPAAVLHRALRGEL